MPSKKRPVDPPTVTERTNGHAPGLQIPRREEWIDIGTLDPIYAGLRVRVWLNFPMVVANGLLNSGGDMEGMKRALGQIVLEHNGWIDFDGEALPAPSEPTFWDRIPIELAMDVSRLMIDAMGKTPNFPKTTSNA